jgi:hypothetical protein
MVTPAQLIERVADYILANGHRIRGTPWIEEDRRTLVAALGFHALNGTLRVEWKVESRKQKAEMPEPAGLAIVWQDFESEVKRLDAAGKSVFRWLPSLERGDCLYCGLVITTAPGVLARLAAWFRRRFPVLPEFAHRRGRLVQFDWLTRLGAGSDQYSVISQQSSVNPQLA